MPKSPSSPSRRSSRRDRELSEAGYEEVARIFRILADPSRLKILYLLRGGPRSVGEVAEALGCAQPTASRQLGRLFEAGILARAQKGTVVMYSVTEPMIFELCEIVCGGIDERQRRKATSLFI